MSFDKIFDLTAGVEYHTQLAKMSFDKVFDLTAGVCLYVHSTLL